MSAIAENITKIEQVTMRILSFPEYPRDEQAWNRARQLIGFSTSPVCPDIYLMIPSEAEHTRADFVKFVENLNGGCPAYFAIVVRDRQYQEELRESLKGKGIRGHVGWVEEEERRPEFLLDVNERRKEGK